MLSDAIGLAGCYFLVTHASVLQEDKLKTFKKKIQMYEKNDIERTTELQRLQVGPAITAPVYIFVG